MRGAEIDTRVGGYTAQDARVVARTRRHGLGSDRPSTLGRPAGDVALDGLDWCRVPAPTIDVTSYNRFLLTVGIALIALSIVAPWLLLQETAKPLLSQQARSELSVPSARGLERREELVEQAFTAVWWFSGGAVAVGAGFLAVGTARLRRRQSVIDRAEDLDVQERELRVRDLTPEEELVRRRAEVSETLQEEIEDVVSSSDGEPESPAIADRSEVVGSAYAAAEQVVLKQLSSAFGPGRVKVGVAVESAAGPQYADAIVRTGDTDLLVEIKYQTVPASFAGPDRARRVLSLVEAYEAARKTPAKGVLLYVLPPAFAASQTRIAFEKRLATRSFDGWSTSARQKVRLVVLGRDELEVMDGPTLRQRLTFS